MKEISITKSNRIKEHIVIADLNQNINYTRIKQFIYNNGLYEIH